MFSPSNYFYRTPRAKVKRLKTEGLRTGKAGKNVQPRKILPAAVVSFDVTLVAACLKSLADRAAKSNHCNT
jgi:hypothetical protein